MKTIIAEKPSRQPEDTLLYRVVMKPLKMVLSGWQITPLQT